MAIIHCLTDFKNYSVDNHPLPSFTRFFKLLSFTPVFAQDPKVSRALRLSVWDGAFFCAMLALTDTFSVAAAVKLHAPSIAIGLLAGLPLLSGSIGQLLVAHFFHSNKGRKKYVLIGTSGQSVFLVVVALTGLLPEQVRAWSYIITFAVQGCFANVIGGLWMAWMSDLVEPGRRGRYFAFRNRIINTAQLVCGLGAGAIAFRQTLAKGDWSFFMMIFCGAAILRLFSTLILSAQYEPKPAAVPAPGPSAPGMKAGKPFLYFCFTIAIMQGAVMLTSPFFNVWSLRDLHFSYFALSVTTASTIFGSIVALPLWGRLSDRIGHHRLLLMTGFMIAVVPFPFLFTGNVVLICVINFFTGAAWAGYNLSGFNQMLLLSDPHSSDRQISFSNALTGISVFIFSLAGGAIAPLLPKILTWQLQSLFLLSGILRVAVYFLLFPGIPAHRQDRQAIRDHLRLFIRNPRDNR
jgi:MFS family permease